MRNAGPSPKSKPPNPNVRRAHLCGCPHGEARHGWIGAGSTWLAVRKSTFRSQLAVLRLADAQLKALQADNEQLLRETKELRGRLAKTLDLSVRSPAFEAGLGGRTAIGTYRNDNVGQFIQNMNKVGDLAISVSPEVAQFFLATAVKADLMCLYAAGPSTEEEARRRAICEWMLTHEGKLRILAGKERWNESARKDFISDVLSSGIDTSTQELVRRSGEVARTHPPRPNGD